MKDNRLTFKFSVVQSLYWTAFCVLASYLTPYYRSLGYDVFMVGVLTMVMSFASAIAQPAWGIFCDRSGKLKQTLIISILISLPFAWLLIAAGKNPVLLTLSIAVLSATFLSMLAIIDAWVMKLDNHGEKVNYSLSRGFGSLFFAIAALVFGRVLDQAGMWVIAPAFMGIAAVLAVTVLFIKAPRPEAHHGKGNGSMMRSVSLLLENRRFMVLIISVSLLFTGTGAIDMTFYPVLMKELGGGNTELGIGFFLMAVSEVPILFFFTKIAKHFHVRTLISFSLFCYILKCLLIAFAPNVTVLILAQGMQMLSYGLLLPAAVHYINDITDAQSMVTAQVLYSSTTYGLGNVVGSLAGGAIAKALGVRSMMFILFSLVLLAFVLFTALSGRDKANQEDTTAVI
jgi:MFS transporter, PPP family, 3-phenylpropionic acid transporter